MFVKYLNNHFAHALARPHDIRGVYRLIRRYHNESFRAGHRGRLCCLKRSEYIVFNRLGGAVLHQRNMFMRRRVINDIRLVIRENPVHPVGIPHGCDEHHKVQIRMFHFQFLLYIINVIFINIENNKLFRLMLRNLSAELASDGAAAARYKHLFALHITENRIHIDADRFSPQQILYLHVAQFADADFSVHELIHTRKRTQLTVRFLTNLQNIFQFRAGSGRHCHDNFIDIINVRTFHNLIPAAGHLDSLDISAPFSLIVIDNTADDHCGKVTVYNFFNDGICRLSCAHHHHGNFIFLILLLMFDASEKAV